MGLGSFYRIFTPTIGAFVFTHYGYEAMILVIVGFLGLAINGSTSINVTFHNKEEEKQQKQQE